MEIRAAHDKTRDVDFYAFHLVAGETLILDIDNTSMDTMLWLYDASGSQLAVNDDNSTSLGGRWENLAGLNSYLEYTTPTSGTYYVAFTHRVSTRSADTNY